MMKGSYGDDLWLVEFAIYVVETLRDFEDRAGGSAGRLAKDLWWGVDLLVDGC